MADEGNRFGGGSVGVGTSAPPAPIEDTPDIDSGQEAWPENFDDDGNQAPAEDVWPENFDDDGNSTGGVEEADKQIYSDAPARRSSQPNKDGVLEKARQIAARNRKTKEKPNASPEAEKKTKTAEKKKDKAHDKPATAKQKILQKAKAAADKARELKDKAKKARAKKEGESEEGETKEGRLKKMLPDKAQLLYDATHGDPRKIVGDLADQYLHYGAIIGFALWAIWMTLAIGGLIPFLIPGLICAVVLNVLLVSPKSVYRISKWILELVGVGEALTVVDTVGAAKADIRLAGWMKFTIIVYDLMLFMLFIGILAFIFAIGKWICDQTGLSSEGVIGTVTSGVVSILGGENGAAATEMCKNLQSVAGGSQ